MAHYRSDCHVAVVLDAFDTTIDCPWRTIRHHLAVFASVTDHELARAFKVTQVDRNIGMYSSVAEEFAAIVRELQLDSSLIEPMARLNDRLIRETASLYFDVSDFVAQCKARRIPTVLLSNCGTTAAAAFDVVGARDLFDLVVRSYEVGYRKPDPAVYAHVRALLPADVHVLYVDDNREFCLGALAANFEAIQITRPTRDVVEFQEQSLPQIDTLASVLRRIDG